MTIRLTILAAVAAFGLALPALAAPMKHHGSTASADNSADQLNAKSLSDAKAGTPYAAPATPASSTTPAMHHGKKATTKS